MWKLSPITAAALSSLAVAACAPSLGPPPPGRPSGPPGFQAADFAWSQAAGRNGVAGHVAHRRGATRYSCAGAGVVLTPETPWSRARMAALYGSTERAALPTEAVRARTPNAPAGDAGPYVKRTTCDVQDRFSFSGLADGAWYVITTARPVGEPQGESVALMRRVITRGGRTVALEL
ncbi:hypothetical protein [Phenylobacterium sp.]|jgi:hypothetical protein|uniref:hypothetical protein n=1 Tax=Phenylobacterium sp. TaxID=1871053 RepID=UPI002F9451CC